MVRTSRIASRSWSRTCAWIALGLALATGAPAQASAETPELRWDAPAGCPTQAALRATLDQVLARVDPKRRRALKLRAHARVTETGPARFSLDLEITTDEGKSQRHVDAATCAELADATTLLISMVDPAAAAEAEQLRAERSPEPTPEPTSSSNPTPTPTPSPETEPRPEPATEPPPETAKETAKETATEPSTEALPLPPPEEPGTRPHPLQGVLGVDLALGRAGLPSFGAGFGLHLGVLRRHLRGELFARYHLPRTQALAGLGELEAAVRYQLGVGGVRGCGLGSVARRVELFGCLGAELGAMRGEGIGLPVSAAHTGLWAALLVTPGLAARLTPWLAVVARGDLGVALARPRFTVRNYGDAHRAPPVSFVLGLGIELRLPPGPVRASRERNRDGSAKSRAIPPSPP
jgi:hypothetical protein